MMIRSVSVDRGVQLPYDAVCTLTVGGELTSLTAGVFAVPYPGTKEVQVYARSNDSSRGAEIIRHATLRIDTPTVLEVETRRPDHTVVIWRFERLTLEAASRLSPLVLGRRDEILALHGRSLARLETFLLDIIGLDELYAPFVVERVEDGDLYPD